MYTGDYLDLYVYPVGRRAFAQRQIAERATQHSLTDIANHAQAAVVHESETLQLELQRKVAGSSSARFSPETVKLDGKLDRAVTGLDGYFDSQIRMYGEDSPRGQAATTIRGATLARRPRSPSPSCPSNRRARAWARSSSAWASPTWQRPSRS